MAITIVIYCSLRKLHIDLAGNNNNVERKFPCRCEHTSRRPAGTCGRGRWGNQMRRSNVEGAGQVLCSRDISLSKPCPFLHTGQPVLSLCLLFCPSLNLRRTVSGSAWCLATQPEPRQFPPFDGWQKRFLWVHQGNDCVVCLLCVPCTRFGAVS